MGLLFVCVSVFACVCLIDMFVYRSTLKLKFDEGSKNFSMVDRSIHFIYISLL